MVIVCAQRQESPSGTQNWHDNRGQKNMLKRCGKCLWDEKSSVATEAEGIDMAE